jgi:tetratricopeptide (TPR) repeat protein
MQRQEASASDNAQQAALGSGVQNVYFGDRGHRAEPPVSITPPFGQRAAYLPIRGRDEILAEFASPGDGSRVYVVHGLGGCGKTRLALEIAYQAGQRDAEVWWVSAAEASGLVAGMRALGRRLGVSEAELDRGDAADVIWQHLARRAGPWLLVFDNADDPQVLAGAGTCVADGLGWLRPVSAEAGMVLVTSRDGTETSWGDWCHRYRLSILPADEAALMLADHAKHRPGLGTDDEARRLAVRLGGLPLALKIAGAYLAESAAVPAAFADPGLIRTYLQYCEALDFAAPGGELTQDQMPSLIGTTWDLSLDLLDARELPEARRLLRLMATFADAPIPYQMLLQPATMSASRLFPAMSGSRLWQVLQALHGFGLIDLDTEGDIADDASGGEPAAPVARLHPLVRDASSPRPGGAGDERAAYMDLAATLLHQAADPSEGLPEDPAAWPVWQLFAPHALEVFTVVEAEDGGLDDTALSAAYAAEMAARFRAEQRLYAEAEAVLRAVAAVRQRCLGPDHPATLDTRHSLARRMLQRRDYGRAHAEFRDVLAARSRVLGPDHPDTLAARHSIARTLAALGDYAGAQAEFRDVLAVRLRILGPDHPRTLGTRYEIARTMAALGDNAGAQAEFLEVLAVQKRVLDPGHLHALGTRYRIARTMAALGDHAEAQAEFRDLLSTWTRLLGPEHPRTLRTRYEIAQTIAALGDQVGAQEEFHAVLAVQLQVLGPDHPETLLTARSTDAVSIDVNSRRLGR